MTLGPILLSMPSDKQQSLCCIEFFWIFVSIKFKNSCSNTSLNQQSYNMTQIKRTHSFGFQKVLKQIIANIILILILSNYQCEFPFVNEMKKKMRPKENFDVNWYWQVVIGTFYNFNVPSLYHYYIKFISLSWMENKTIRFWN